MLDAKVTIIVGALSIAASFTGYGVIYGDLNHRVSSNSSWIESREEVPTQISTLATTQTHVLTLLTEARKTQSQFIKDIADIKADLKVSRMLLELQTGTADPYLPEKVDEQKH